jgi:hypothetical protein
MGSSTAPKTFAPSTSFGASPQTPIATETQPLALNSGTQTPAMSGYQMQMNTPITSPTASTPSVGGDAQDVLAQLRARRASGGGSQRPMPFYG